MNRGAVIPLVDEKYIDDLYRLRGAIQSMLARDAARLATPAQVETLMAHCQAYEDATQRNDIAGCVESNRLLHAFLDGIGNNQIAVDLLQGRSSLVDAYRRAMGYGNNRQETVIAQHRALANVIAAKDEGLATRLSLEHTDTSRTDLLAMLRKSAAQRASA